jgi:hypothetical protein
MPAFVLLVSRPDRRGFNWTVPVPVEGQSAHYLYDITLKGRLGVRVGSKVFLWGTKRSGKYGLFGSGTCLIPDDQTLPQHKNFDAFMLIQHDRALARPISTEDLISRFEQLRSLGEKLKASTLLEFVRLTDEQEHLLDEALMIGSASDKRSN